MQAVDVAGPRSQVVSFRSARLDADLDLLPRKINSCMPPDARVVSLQLVPPDFSARFSAVRKHYTYTLHTTAVLDPMSRNFATHVPSHLDVEAMR